MEVFTGLAGIVPAAARVPVGHRSWGTPQTLTDRQGWMRLVGVGPAVHNALDDATPSECLLVYQASDWTGDLTG